MRNTLESSTDGLRRRVSFAFCLTVLSLLAAPGFAWAGELASHDHIACGPEDPPPVIATWVEVASENDAAELAEPLLHLALENRGHFDVEAMLSVTFEHDGATRRRELGKIRLDAGEKQQQLVRLPVSTLRAGQSAERTSFLFAHAQWLSEDGEHSGKTSSPVLYFFPRSEGVSVFGDEQMRSRLLSGSDIPESRLAAHASAETGTQLEMAFDETGFSRSAPNLTDDSAALAAEQRALASQNPTSETNR